MHNQPHQPLEALQAEIDRLETEIAKYKQVALRAKEFWHALPLDAILTTPAQVGACTRLEDALTRVKWMNEE